MHSIPAFAAPPPRMPQNFDQAVVHGLIDAIEQGDNATVLKVGYFLRRTAHPYPAAQGYALIQSAINKEPAFSKRWFVLQSVKAWAAFYAGPGHRDEGYEAYNQIFSNADRSTNDSQEVVQRSIYEFALTLPGEFGTRNFGRERSAEVLRKALQVHLDYLKKNNLGTYKIPWKEAIIAASGSDAFEPFADIIINDTGFKRTFVLLRTAAAIYSVSKPKKAIDLLLEARPLLPLQDTDQVRSYFNDLVALLQSTGQPGQAIALQKEMVRSTGYGRAQLAVMQLQSGDDKAFAATVQELGEATANDLEVIDTVRSLIDAFSSNTSPEDKAYVAVKQILSKYLKTRPRLKIEQELTARLLLGKELLRHGDEVGARQVLAIEHLKAGITTPSGHALFLAAQHLLEQINATPAVTDPNPQHE